MTRLNIHVYPAGEMPDVLVQLDDGKWAIGEARMRWQESDSGIWMYQVQYRPPGTNTRAIDRFPVDRVRPDETVRGPKGG